MESKHVQLDEDDTDMSLVTLSDAGREDYLQQLLDLLTGPDAQTWRHWLVISGDKSRKKLREGFIKKHPEVDLTIDPDDDPLVSPFAATSSSSEQSAAPPSPSMPPRPAPAPPPPDKNTRDAQWTQVVGGTHTPGASTAKDVDDANGAEIRALKSGNTANVYMDGAKHILIGESSELAGNDVKRLSGFLVARRKGGNLSVVARERSDEDILNQIRKAVRRAQPGSDPDVVWKPQPRPGGAPTAPKGQSGTTGSAARTATALGTHRNRADDTKPRRSSEEDRQLKSDSDRVRAKRDERAALAAEKDLIDFDAFITDPVKACASALPGLQLSPGLVKAAKRVRDLDGSGSRFAPKDLRGNDVETYEKLPTELKEKFIRVAATFTRMGDLMTDINVAKDAAGADTPAGKAFQALSWQVGERRKPSRDLLATYRQIATQIATGVGATMDEVKGVRKIGQYLDEAEKRLTKIKTLSDYEAANGGPLRTIGVELSKSVALNPGNQHLLKLQSLWNQRSDVIYALVKGQALARNKALQKVARENLKDEQLRLEKADVDALRKRWADLIELARKEYLQHVAAKT